MNMNDKHEGEEEQIPKPCHYPEDYQLPNHVQQEHDQVREGQHHPPQAEAHNNKVLYYKVWGLEMTYVKPGTVQNEGGTIAGEIAKAKAKMAAIKARDGKPRPTVCDLCGDTYWGAKGRETHYKRRHSKECPECKKVFSRVEHMEYHKLYAHSSNPPMHQCEECGKLFKQKQSLTRHSKEVHRGRYFECKDCSATFTREVKLDSHIILKHKM